jgi:hypothetical protein
LTPNEGRAQRNAPELEQAFLDELGEPDSFLVITSPDVSSETQIPLHPTPASQSSRAGRKGRRRPRARPSWLRSRRGWPRNRAGDERPDRRLAANDAAARFAVSVD